MRDKKNIEIGQEEEQKCGVIYIPFGKRYEREKKEQEEKMAEPKKLLDERT